MDRHTVSGVEVFKFPRTWWHVTYSHEWNEWVVIEVHELPQQEDLSHFKNMMDAAIELARQKNSDLRKKRANGQTFTV